MMAPSRRGPGPGGFSVLELTIACAMTGLLAAMILTTWSAYDRASAEMIARCRLAQEADLAMTQLSADLGSVMAPTAVGHKGRGRPTGLLAMPDRGGIQILFEDPEAPQDSRVVIYEVREETRELAQARETIRRRMLLRRVESIEPPAIVEASRVVAWDADGVSFAAIQGGWYEFRLSFELPFRSDRSADLRLERTYSLVARVP